MTHFQPTEEQKKKLILIEQRRQEYKRYWASRSSQKMRETEPVLLKTGLHKDDYAHLTHEDKYARRARQAISEHPRPEYPKAEKSYDCEKCKDTARLQMIIPNEVITRYIWCPACSLERKRKNFERNWPLTPLMLELSQEPLQSLTKPTDESFNKAFQVCKALVSNSFPPALILLTGDYDPAYGTGKSHLLARLWAGAWKLGMTCILTSSPQLEKKFTKFNDEEERERVFDMLYNVDVLLVDEAHRITIKDGNGWAERNLFTLVNHLLENKKTIVLAANSLAGIHSGIVNRAKDRRRGGVMIDLSSVSSYRERYLGTPDWLKGIY